MIFNQMNEVTPFMALVILILIVIASFFICFTIKPNNFEHSRTKVFITSLASLGIFVTFLFYYSVVDLQQQQKLQAKIQETSKITDTIQNTFILNIEKYYNEIPNFTSTLLPLLNLDHKNEESEEKDKKLLKYVLSYQIFSVWQDMIISDEFIAVDNVSLISGALQRAHSLPLKEFWKTIKIDFSNNVQKFGDLLFEWSSKIKNQIPEEYEKTSKEFIESKEYKNIFI